MTTKTTPRDLSADLADVFAGTLAADHAAIVEQVRLLERIMRLAINAAGSLNPNYTDESAIRDAIKATIDKYDTLRGW